MAKDDKKEAERRKQKEKENQKRWEFYERVSAEQDAGKRPKPRDWHWPNR